MALSFANTPPVLAQPNRVENPYHLPLISLFHQLPKVFYTEMQAEKFSQNPFVIATNQKANELIDLKQNNLEDPNFAGYFSGNLPLTPTIPLAMVYAGHQFGIYVPRLGDGRALLLAQIRNHRGEYYDIQLKGSGKTPYSRFADGRAVLRSTIREYLGSEMLAALGIPTSRALCIIGTNEMVLREQWEQGAILTRLAKNHIRFGHFEYFAHSGQTAEVKILADHVIQYYFPNIWKNYYRNATNSEIYELWFSQVVTATAKLIAQWQAVGFCHGVMNTDNMNISGLTLDYGPFGFLETYNPDFVCNHSDVEGRYSYRNQPKIAWWNLYALSIALTSIIPKETSEKILEKFGQLFETELFTIFAQKLGFTKLLSYDANNQAEIKSLILNWLEVLQQLKLDFTKSFFVMQFLARDILKLNPPNYANSNFNPMAENWYQKLKDILSQDKTGKEFLKNYQIILQKYANNDSINAMAKHNPIFVLRNWVAQKTIEAATNEKNYQLIADVLSMCQNPFNWYEKFAAFYQPAPAEYKNLTISCSS